jgi:DNA/RNA endonuclease YhcR with UshA esterase domain
MTENRALLLASASILGIMLIGYISDLSDVEITDLNTIDSNKLNDIVHVRGVVHEYSKFNGGIKVLIEQDEYRMKVAYFTDSEEELIIKKGMCVDVLGDVQTYKSSMEIVAKEITFFIC